MTNSCGECGGTGMLTRLGGDWGKAQETQVPCWACKPAQHEVTNYCDVLPCLNDAEVEVVLADGDCYEVCKDHVALIIQTKASTENPVHELIDYTMEDRPVHPNNVRRAEPDCEVCQDTHEIYGGLLHGGRIRCPHCQG